MSEIILVGILTAATAIISSILSSYFTIRWATKGESKRVKFEKLNIAISELEIKHKKYIALAQLYIDAKYSIDRTKDTFHPDVRKIDKYKDEIDIKDVNTLNPLTVILLYEPGQKSLIEDYDNYTHVLYHSLDQYITDAYTLDELKSAVELYKEKYFMLRDSLFSTIRKKIQ